jgi:hypothetical protein
MGSELGSVDLALLGLAIPATMGLVQVIKQAGLPHCWAGLVAVVVGIACGVLLHLAGVGGGSTGMAAVAGLIAGLSAAGAWSTARNTAQAVS